MQALTLGFLAVSVLGTALGCNSTSVAQQPATPAATPKASPVPESAWNSLQEQTQCEAMDPYYCVGAFGFTVFNDGSYQAGPSPAGQTVSGRLNSSEYATINNDANAVTDSDLNSPIACNDPQPLPPGSNDQLDYNSSGPDSQDFLVYEMNSLSIPGSDCYSGDQNHIKPLHNDMKSAMTKYYPRPFPGASPAPSPSPSP